MRADIEKDIGWDFSDTCAEDSLFGYVAYKKYGGIFGWHGGVLEEQSPFTFSDFIKQRQRWIKGTFENLGRMGIWEKIKTTYRMTSWLLGSISSSLLILSLFIEQWYPWYITPFLIFNTIILFSVYQIGLGMNFSKVERKKRIYDHIKIFLLSPVLWFLEAIPMAMYLFKKAAPKFYVIKK